MNTDDVTPITVNTDLSNDSREIAASNLRRIMESLTIYAAALKASDCEVARAVGERLGPFEIYNDLDVVREILEKGDFAIALTGASKLD